MRVLLRLVLVLIFIGIIAGVGYWFISTNPALRNLITISVIPGQPTVVSEPSTEVAALPTAIPPATAPPSPLPPTPPECVAAAAVSAGGNAVRQNENAPGNARTAQRPLPQGQQAQVNVPPGRIRNQALIEFTPDSSTRERFLYIRSIGARPRRNIQRLNTVVVELANDIDPATLPPSPVVISVQADYPVAAAQVQIASNDPLAVDQWALPVINAPAVWPALPPNTPPVTVAVIDSGICLDHPDLAGRIVPGWDFIDGDDRPQDDFGHGCGVAGVIAANANNGTGIAGVAPNARIMPLRVLDASGMGSFSDVAAAIVYATDSGAQIINMSLAGPATNDTVRDAIDYAASRGVVMIGAAGNGGIEGVWYPAAYDAVIAVGSVDQTLERSAFSNYGAGIDLVAPGRDIYTTSNTNDYQTMTGTSFAAPHVSGIAALAMAFNTPLNTDGGLAYISAPEAIC